MTLSHADPTLCPTRGPRGETTEERAETVRGPEGSYVADVKDELMTREPWIEWEVRITADFGHAIQHYSSRYGQQHHASDYADSLRERSKREGAFESYFTVIEVVPVLMRYEWEGGRPVKRVVSGV